MWLTEPHRPSDDRYREELAVPLLDVLLPVDTPRVSRQCPKGNKNHVSG